MNLDEAIADVERRFAGDDGPAGPHDAAGRPYVILCSGGVKEEAKDAPALYGTPEEAAEAWLIALQRLIAVKLIAVNLPMVPGASILDQIMRTQLHWRVRPEMQTHKGKFYVYSRLTIEAPELEATI